VVIMRNLPQSTRGAAEGLVSISGKELTMKSKAPPPRYGSTEGSDSIRKLMQ
jgi:hypothetical protein